jgi:hypothetical protein
MKFDVTLIKSIVLVILLINSQVISISTNIKVYSKNARINKSERKRNSNNYSRKSKAEEDSNDCKYGEEFPINIVTLVIEAASVVSSSFSDEIINLLTSNKYWEKTVEKTLDLQCRDVIQEAFTQEVDRIKEEKGLERVVITELNKFKSDVGKIWINSNDKQELVKNRDNPRKLCEINERILENNKKELSEWSTQGMFLIDKIDRIIQLGYSLNDIKEKANANNNVFSGNGLVIDRKRYINAYTYLSERLSNLKKDDDLEMELLNIKKETMQAIDLANQNLSEYQNFNVPKCERLPSSNINFGKCLIVGYLTYVKAFWNMSKNFQTHVIEKKEQLKTCLSNLLINTVLNIIINNTVEFLLSILTGIVGYLIYKIFKIAFYAVSIFYNLFMLKEANEENSVEKRSIVFGRIIGYALKIAISLIHIKKKRNKSK